MKAVFKESFLWGSVTAIMIPLPTLVIGWVAERTVWESLAKFL